MDRDLCLKLIEEIEKIRKDLDKMQEIKVGENGEYATISYSALSYVRSALLAENTDAALLEMVTALYRYSVAANAYFAAKN